MTKTAEKTADPALPLEGAVTGAQPSPSRGRALASHKGHPPAAAPAASPALSEHQALLAMISAAAANPDVNVDKLDRLLALRDRVNAQQAETLFDQALSEVQAKIPPVKPNKRNKQTKSNYASYDALDAVARLHYVAAGFSVSFDTADAPLPEYVRVVCFVTNFGHLRTYHFDVPADGKGAKGRDVMTKTHAAKSAVTYGKTTLLTNIFNIVVINDRSDDDGNAAGKTLIDDVDPEVPKISQKQIDALVEKCDVMGCPRPRFLTHIHVARFEDIPAADFDQHMTLIGTFQKAK